MNSQSTTSGLLTRHRKSKAFSAKRRALTFIEILIVVIIIGLLAAVAIPAYTSSVKTTRTNTANANAQVIANAIQSDYTHNGYGNYGSYATSALANTNVVSDLGGVIPVNPCTGGATSTDWTISVSDGVSTNSKLTVTAANTSNNCTGLKIVQLGN